MQVTLHVGNVDTRIVGIKRRTPVYRELDKRLSYSIPGAYFSAAYQNQFWDGKGHLLDEDVVPTGVVPFVTEILKRHGIKWSFKDNREFVDDFSDPDLPGIALRPYQKIAVAQMLRQRRGVVQIPTGGGKTFVAASAIKALNIPTIYIVHTRTLLYQTVDEFRQVLPHVGVVGGGDIDFNFVTVALVQSLMSLIKNKKQSIFNNYRCLICDEAHHLSSPRESSWYVASTYFQNASYRFGMSATVHGRKSGMLLQAATGPIIVRIPVSVLQGKNYISEARIKFFKMSEPKLPLSYDYNEAYDEGIIQNAFRNQKAVEVALKHGREGKLVMIYVDRIEHGRQIADALPRLNSGDSRRTVQNQRSRGKTGMDIPPWAFLTGEDSSERIKEVKKQAKNRQIKILIVTRKLFGEGVDIPAVDVLINLAAGKSMTVFVQMFGRGLRKAEGKEHLQYYDFEDDTHRYLRLHSRARMGHCRKLKQKVDVEVVDVARIAESTSLLAN